MTGRLAGRREPAEQSYFQRLFALIDRTPPELFTSLRELETKMSFPKALSPLEEVDFLNRSPYYSQWRAAVADVFVALTGRSLGDACGFQHRHRHSLNPRLGDTGITRSRTR